MLSDGSPSRCTNVTMDTEHVDPPMLDVWNPTLYTLDGAMRMRVLPKLTIDRILLLSVLLSFVYLVLYGTIPSDGTNTKPVAPRRRQQNIRPGDAFLRLHANQSRDPAPAWWSKRDLQPSIAGVNHSDVLGSVSQGRVRTCSPETRISYLRDKCTTSPARDDDYGQGTKQAIRYAVVDSERKLFYCLIGKAGSKSWLQYMVDSKDTEKKGHLRHNSFLEKVGLKMLRNLPLEKVTEDYGDYLKFLVVRHPLQRAVSAYYETVVLHEKYHDDQGTLLNFTGFVQRVTSDLLDENPHWRRYVSRCKVCKVDYQRVIKTETMDEDIREFNEVLGDSKAARVGVEFGHQNRFFGGGGGEEAVDMPKDVHHYKYDKMLYGLQRKQPGLMKKFINVYGDDMQLFGYKWDWQRGKSSCGMEYKDRACC